MASVTTHGAEGARGSDPQRRPAARRPDRLHDGPGRPAFPVFVQSIEDGIVTFDMNHELAGKDLNFDIELVEVED